MSFEWSFEGNKKDETTWTQFYDCIHETGSDKGVPFMACNHCHKKLTHPNSNSARSPHSLKRHLKICNTYKGYLRTQDSQFNMLNNMNNYTNKEAEIKATAQITEELITQRVLDFFLSGDIPFNQADNPHFKNLISLIRVNVESASNTDYSDLKLKACASVACL